MYGGLEGPYPSWVKMVSEERKSEEKWVEFIIQSFMTEQSYLGNYYEGLRINLCRYYTGEHS